MKTTLSYFICYLALGFVSTTRAQDINVACDPDRLAEGDRAFNLTLFDDAIALLEPCLPTGFPEQERAHRLVILSYIELEDDAAAQTWTESLLDINPRYQVTADDPNYFRLLVEDLRPKKWHQRWLWRATMGGGALGIAAGILVLTREGPPEPLAGPPDFPPPPGQ